MAHCAACRTGFSRVSFGWKADIAQSPEASHDAAMHSETGKLPKGQSYPLRPSKLAAALAGAGIAIDVHLVRSPGDLFDAQFWPPNPNIPYERLYVRAGSVPAKVGAAARRQAETTMIPALVKWVAGILALDENSPIRREKQRMELPRV